MTLIIQAALIELYPHEAFFASLGTCIRLAYIANVHILANSYKLLFAVCRLWCDGSNTSPSRTANVLVLT